MTSPVFVARASGGKMVVAVAGAAIFVAMGAYMVAYPEGSRRYDPAIVQLFGIVSILFFGGVALIGLRRLFSVDPLIEIGESGIRYTHWSKDLIPWAAIRRAEIRDYGRHKFLALLLNKPKDYPTTTLLGRFQSLNKGMGFGDISIGAQGSDRSFDAVVEAVAAFKPGLIER